MANAYSQPANFGQTVSLMPMAQLNMQVQTAMQQKYDANVAKVDSIIQQFTSVPLLRAEDKQYFGERLQTLLSAVDSNSKINWTSSNASREVMNHISAAVDDRVLKQISNSQAIINFEQSAAEKKAKNPQLYNDANYTYAKDKAGYEDYLKGYDKNGNKVDDIGSLQLLDYYDIDKNLTDEVEKFAKDRGYEKLLKEDQSGYVYRTVKGKQVTEDEIAGYVKLKMSSDPRLQQQMLINSHVNNRNSSDEEVYKKYSEHVNSQVSYQDTKIQEIENQLKNVNPDDVTKKQELERKRTLFADEKNLLLSQLDPTNFNRDAVLFESYKNNLVNTYAKTFSYEDITDVKYDDFFIKLAKAEGKLTAEGTPTGMSEASLPVGQAIEIPRTEIGETAPDVLDTFTKDREVTWAQMNEIMRQRLKAEGKAVTSKNLQEYYLGLKKASKEGFDVNAQGYTAEEIATFQKVEDFNKKSFRITKEAKNFYDDAVEKTAEGLFVGKTKDLNVDNLATTMPFTAGILKKYNSLEQLSKKERDLVLYETALNAKDYLLEDEKDKQLMDFYLSSLERENSISKEDLKKVKLPEKQGFWSNTWEGAKSVAGMAGNLFKIPATSIQMLYRQEEGAKNQEEVFNSIEKYGSGFIEEGVGAANAFKRAVASDVNLSDINLQDTGAKDTPSILFKKASESVKSRVYTNLERAKENAPMMTAIALNSEVKADKPYVQSINTALIAQGYNPATDGAIIIKSVEGNEAIVEFTQQDYVMSKTGTSQSKIKRTETGRVSIKNIPTKILESVNLNQVDYEFSVKNPNPMTIPFKYSPPLDLDSSIQMGQKYIQNNQRYLKDREIQHFRQNGFNVVTKEEMAKSASTLPPEYYNAFLEDLSAQYQVVWDRPEGGGNFTGILKKNGKSITQGIQVGENFNPHLYQTLTMEQVEKYLQGRLTELKLQSVR
jgi:hypothetical protein